MNQKHITILERESIFKFLILGYSKSKIAEKINRPRCTVTREINRNTIDGEYIPSKAQIAYNRRKKTCGAKKLLYNSILVIDIQDKLEEGWTPE